MDKIFRIFSDSYYPEHPVHHILIKTLLINGDDAQMRFIPNEVN